MEGADFTIQVYTLDDEKFAERGGPSDSDEEDLPSEFDGYQRSSQTLVVTATPTGSEIIAGMGGGWVYRHPEKPELLWIRSAEVNEPYRQTGLERTLIGVLLKTAEEKEFAGACIVERLRQHLVIAASGND